MDVCCGKNDWVCVSVCVFLYHSNENYSALPVLFVAIQASEKEYFQV